MKSTRTLELYASFDCTGCGECCRDWRIHVDKVAYEQAVDLLAGHTHPRRITTPEEAFIQIEEPTDETYVILKNRPDGYCVFLDDDNLCYWHKHFGYESKGWVCRSYPNESFQTPTGMNIIGSLSCRPMAELLRDEFQGPAKTVEAPVDFAKSAREVQQWTVKPGAAIWIEGDRLMEGEAIETVQSALMDFVAIESVPLGVRLRMGRLFLEALRQKSMDRNPLPARTVTQTFEDIEADATDLVLRAAAMPMEAQVLTHAVRVFFARMAKVGVTARVAKRFESFIDALQLNSPAQLITLHLQRLHEERFDAAALTGLLTGYAGHRLFRSQAVPKGGLIPGFTEVLLSMLLVWSISMAIASLRDVRVDDDILTEAIHNAELIFFHSPVFESFLKTDSGLQSIHTPAFAGVLTAPFL